MANRAFCSVLFLCVVPVLFAMDYNQYVVPCDHSMASCTCPLYSDSVKVDVCIYTLTIANYQTFTAYRIDPVTNQIAFPHGGKLYYINETMGEFAPFPEGVNICNSLTPSCTHPFTVDGYSYLTYTAINGRIPGPALIAHFNQTIFVNVTNTLDSETVSIHWHGMLQNHAHFMDGVQHVSQCGINSGSSFSYIFQANPPGTHWYHSQVGSQRNNGVHGALIILDEEDTLVAVKGEVGIDFNDYPSNHTLIFQDWQNSDAGDILLQSAANTRFYYTDNGAPDPAHYAPPTETVTVDGTSVGQLEFWSGLINGRGRYYNVSYTKTRLSIFTVSPDETYRFRLIGGQHYFAFIISFDEHQLQVLSKDGSYVSPVTVDYLIIQPGERYDILLKAKSLRDLKDGKNDFMIRGQTLEVNNGRLFDGRGHHIVEGILHYDTSPLPVSTDYEHIADKSIPVYETCSSGNPCVVLNCPFKQFPLSFNMTCLNLHHLKLLHPLNEPIHLPDKTLFFNFGFDGVGESDSVNARNNRLPSSPLALLNTSQLELLADKEFCQDLANPDLCDDEFNHTNCVCSNVYRISYDSSVILVLSAVTARPEDTPTLTSSHSIHLHGHQFRILDVQYGDYTSTGQLVASNRDISCGGRNRCTVPNWRAGQGYRLPDGGISNVTVIADTITVPAGGYVVVYIHANNPGYWYLHCESEIHHVPGMGVILMEGDVNQMAPPPQEMNQCGNFLWTLDDYHKTLSGNNASTGSNDSSSDITCYYYYSVLGVLVLLAVLLSCSVLITIVSFVLCIRRHGDVASGGKYKQIQSIVHFDED